MIGPSRRRQVRRPQRDPFTLHSRISRQQTRSRLLLYASAAALAASLIAWLAGAGLAVHAGVTIAALLLTMFAPLPRATRWALDWIAGQVGFSYQTALETRGHEDPYGLHAAVAERAHRRVRNIETPRATSWWLPVLALALGLLLLPAASLPAFGGGGPGGGGPAPVVGSDERATEPELPTPETADPIDQPDEPRRADEPAGDGGDSDASEELGGDSQGDSDSEQQVLDRFLDNLRERDPATEEQQQQGGAAPPNLQPSAETGDDSGEDQDGDRSSRPNDGEREPGEGDGDAGEQEGASEQGEETGPQEGDEQQPGEQAGQAEPGDDQSTGGFEPGEAPGGDAPPEGGNTPDESDGDEGLGAGDLGSDPQPSGALDGESENEPEFLGGELGNGPENPGGLIRLPGREEIDLPTEIDTQSYLQAAEEAVTEGDLPVDYQEVIRNYFR